jgi:GT2 family glycosyltransferase
MVSIVVLTYNSADTLADCLRALVRVKEAELILVDNHSTDDSVAIARRHKSIRVVRAPKNLGYNGGNQLGLEASHGDIVVFLNPDTTVPSSFAHDLETAFANHPNVGVIGCRILNPDGSLQRTCNRFPTLGSLLYEHSGYHTLFPHSRAYRRYIYAGWDRTSERFVDAVSGACTAVRRQTLEAIGGLDTGYFLFYEEFDLSRRAMRLGQAVLFTPAITIRHIGSTSTKKLDTTFVDATYHASRNRYLKQHQGRLFLVSFSVLTFCCNKLAGLKQRLSRIG